VFDTKKENNTNMGISFNYEEFDRRGAEPQRQRKGQWNSGFPDIINRSVEYRLTKNLGETAAAPHPCGEKYYHGVGVAKFNRTPELLFLK
jgi:hypothetical protein